MAPRSSASAIAAGLALAAGAAHAQIDVERLKAQVFETERAFARSMAERDHAAFVRHLSEHATFFDGPRALRGSAAVAAAWKPYFDAPKAPFSWEPDQVDLLADGTLALSTGPVRDPQGKPIARFSSIWRQESPGVWRIVFDRGESVRE